MKYNSLKIDKTASDYSREIPFAFFILEDVVLAKVKSRSPENGCHLISPERQCASDDQYHTWDLYINCYCCSVVNT